MSDLHDWLSGIGLEGYAETFAENDIDLEVLDELSEEDLKELGLSLGHRKKLLKALRSVSSNERNSDVVDSGDQAPRSPDATLSAEKRFLSLMFCDLADSTRIAAALDMEDTHELNRAYQDACTEAIHAHHGYVARYMGDGILAYFGYPQAREDDAERAVNAGLAIISAIEALKPRFDLPEGIELAVRIGIASGPVVVEAIGDGDARENAVVGEAPNLAARLQGLAAADRVMVGPETHRLLEHAFGFRDCGLQSIKGYLEPMGTWEVIARRSEEERYRYRSDRYLTTLIGREEELRLLESRWQRSAGGAGQVVLLSAEAGMGKSRLVDALIGGIDIAHNRVRFYCSPNHVQSPLYPIISRLLREAERAYDETDLTPRQRLGRLLAEKYQCPDELIPAIESMAFVKDSEAESGQNADPRQVMSMLQDLLVESLVGQSREKPLIIVLEDAHWIDASTQTAMDILVERIHNQPVLLLMTHRLEKQLPYTSAHVTRLSLSSLSGEQSSTLIQEIAAGLPDDTIRDICDKGAGIPLFLEEVTKAVADRRNDANANPGNVPESLQATLLSALDRLGAAKILAQCGAVIGQSFWKDMVAHVSHQSGQIVNQGLDALVSGQITVREPRGDNELFRFRHALLRDAAYESLLRNNRIKLHGMVADYLDGIGHTDERANQAIIAYHYAMAGNKDKAFQGWLEAGQAALQAGATTEAVELLDNAAKVLPDISGDKISLESRYRFHMSHGQALNASRGAAAETAHEAFRRAAGIGRDMDNVFYQVDALDYLFGITFNAGELEASITHAEEMLAIGEARDDDVARVSGHQGLGMAFCTLGRFHEAKHHLEAALAYADKSVEGINCFPSMTMDYLSYVWFFLGEHDRAAALCEQAIQSAHHESQYAAVTALTNSCFTRMLLGDHTDVKRYSEQAMSLAQERGQYMVSDRALLFHNLATAWLEPGRDSLEEVVAATNRLYESHEMIDLTYLIGMTAEVEIEQGKLEQAAASLDRALAISEDTGEVFYRAELCRLKGELIRAGGNGDAAGNIDHWLSEAKALATAQQAHGLLKRLERSEAAGNGI